MGRILQVPVYYPEGASKPQQRERIYKEPGGFLVRKWDEIWRRSRQPGVIGQRPREKSAKQKENPEMRSKSPLGRMIPVMSRRRDDELMQAKQLPKARGRSFREGLKVPVPDAHSGSRMMPLPTRPEHFKVFGALRRHASLASVGGELALE